MFQKALPIWKKNSEKEINLYTVLTAEFSADNHKDFLLRMTGATLYRVYLNGVFVHYGPARAPHGYARVDELDITLHIVRGKNIISIEVAGYNCPSYYTIDGISFLCAEIIADNNKVVIYTGNDFNVCMPNERVQKCARYSYQRTFSEVWNLSHNREKTFEDIDVIYTGLELLPREVSYPLYTQITPKKYCGKGNFAFNNEFKSIKNHRFLYECEKNFVHYSLSELERNPYYDLQKLSFTPVTDVPSKKIKAGEYLLIDMGCNYNGFIKSEMVANQDSRVFIIFDEKMINNCLNHDYWQGINIVEYNLKQSETPYIHQTFETYGFQYIWVAVIDGEITLSDISIIEYVTSDLRELHFDSGDDELNLIFDAAYETYRQNTLDIFMDCPTRERAGWLCDSYFTAQSALLFSGNTTQERVFLDNFVLAKKFPKIPDGMLPMCYPADHNNGNFIPQWALWYVVELDEYYKRSGDNNIARFKPICIKLLQYFSSFENEYQLLEKLDGWNFVEWSDANKYVMDVNFPTNMLYYKVLTIVGELYDMNELINKAERIKNKIIELSYDGKFFIDNAIRNKDGKLELTHNRTEICQYSAFFFNVIPTDDEQYTRLKHIVLNVFGADRKEKGIMPEIGCANAFIGNYMRMELLMRWGMNDKAVDECRAYFGDMARITGTLWEHNDILRGSLNHGFASYIGVVLFKSIMEK